MIHPTAKERAAALATAPRGFWFVAKKPATEQYPCRCHERKFNRCSAAWCPCAGREDPPTPECCGNRFTLQDHREAMAAWRIKKAAERAAELVPDEEEAP